MGDGYPSGGDETREVVRERERVSDKKLGIRERAMEVFMKNDVEGHSLI